MSLSIPQVDLFTFPNDDHVGILDNADYTEITTTAGVMRTLRSQTSVESSWLQQSFTAYQNWFQSNHQYEESQLSAFWYVVFRFELQGVMQRGIASVYLSLTAVTLHIQHIELDVTV